MASARAMATRCRSPTESLHGRCHARWLMPTSDRSSSALAIRSRRRRGPSNMGICTFSTRGQRGQQMERLEDETERLGPKAVEVLARGEAAPLETNLAARRPIEGAHQVQQCRFAAAAGAHDGEIFAAADRERDVGKALQRARPRNAGRPMTLQAAHPGEPCLSSPP